MWAPVHYNWMVLSIHVPVYMYFVSISLAFVSGGAPQMNSTQSLSFWPKFIREGLVNCPSPRRRIHYWHTTILRDMTCTYRYSQKPMYDANLNEVYAQTSFWTAGWRGRSRTGSSDCWDSITSRRCRTEFRERSRPGRILWWETGYATASSRERTRREWRWWCAGLCGLGSHSCSAEHHLPCCSLRRNVFRAVLKTDLCGLFSWPENILLWWSWDHLPWQAASLDRPFRVTASPPPHLPPTRPSCSFCCLVVTTCPVAISGCVAWTQSSSTQCPRPGQFPVPPLISTCNSSLLVFVFHRLNASEVNWSRMTVILEGVCP